MPLYNSSSGTTLARAMATDCPACQLLGTVGLVYFSRGVVLIWELTIISGGRAFPLSPAIGWRVFF